jgi:hypothetical protein
MKLRVWLSGLIALVSLIVAQSTTARAYFIPQCNGSPYQWDNPVEQYRGDAFIGGSADWFGGFHDSLAIWRKNPTYLSFFSTLDISFNYNTALNNGHSEVWAQPNDATDIFNGDAYAAIGPWYVDGCAITEGDVVYNMAFDYVNSQSKADYVRYGSDKLSLQAVTIHELGHNAGFDHGCSIYNVMGDSSGHLFANGDQAGQYVGEDLVNGLTAIYTEIPVLQTRDVSVVHWRYSGCNNPYSVHRRTEILDDQGNELTKVDDTALEPRYIAQAGQTIDARFTFETLGSVSTQNGIEVGFYYSDDDTITTMDRRIGGTSISLVRDEPDTVKLSISLPGDIPQGEGYLGIIVDENDLINESRENNNATYIGMLIDGVTGDGGDDGNGEKLSFRYAAKFVCGRQDDRSDKRLEPGTYSTTVNILNPGEKDIRIFKQVAVTYPPDPQEQGETYDLGFDPLASLHALETNCDDIRERAFNGTLPTPYVEGFVVVTSPRSIDVTAVYTARSLADEELFAMQTGDLGANRARRCGRQSGDCPCRTCGCCGCCGGGGNGGGDPGGNPGTSSGRSVSVDVEQIRERRVKRIPPPTGDRDKPDLLPVPGRASNPNSQSGYCRVVNGQLLVRVKNQGPAQSKTSTTTVTYVFDNNPIIRATAVLGPAGHPVDEIDVPFPYPDNRCFFGSASDNVCAFRIEVDSGGHNDETNETNNTAVGACFKPEG